MTFTQAKGTLAAIVAESERARVRLEAVRSEVNSVKAALDNMPTRFGQSIADIAAEAATKSADADWKRLKAESDKLVADFVAFSSEVTALQAAVNQ